MGSLEHESLTASIDTQTRVTIPPTYLIPASTSSLDSPDHASSPAEAWGILIDTGAATSVAPKGFASHIELSPAPSMIQLTTATGLARETYGLRKVHLQCRGLSLEVSFVIADVVTPMLGLDIMIHNTLSLQVDHDSNPVLVNPAGERTQLQHIGRHLCLIACPSERSLTQCFIGSLSKVIGFLPADKELHDQRSASRSSSSPDLDEDTSKPQVAQDSLQSVLQAACGDNDISFQQVLSTDEDAAKGGEPKVSLYPVRWQPQRLATHERALHIENHMPSSRCVECYEAKARASQLRNSQTSIMTSTIQLQYAYMRQPQDQKPTMILTWVESVTGLACSFRRDQLHLNLMQWSTSSKNKALSNPSCSVMGSQP